MDMDRDGSNNPPHNFLHMLNSLIRNDNILLRTELININESDNSNRGCSEEYINSLEENTIDDEMLKKSLQCSICLDDFKLNDKYIALDCDEPHIFHSGCETCSGIKEWLKRNNTCPMCRKEFPTESNEPLSGSGRTSDILQSIILHTSIIPPVNNTESDDTTQENIIPNPNTLENRISNIITNYINEIEQSNEQRDIQLAIQASLNDI